MVVESHTLFFSLTITAPENQLEIRVARSAVAPISASVNIALGTAQEKAVRSFCGSRGLQLPTDSSIPASFLPHLPVEWMCDISPVPSTAHALSEILADLFIEVCGLERDSVVSFDYHEML